MAAIRLAMAALMLMGMTPPIELSLTDYRPAQEFEVDEVPNIFEDKRVVILTIDEKGREAVERRERLEQERLEQERIQAERDSTQTAFLTNFYPGDSLTTSARTSTGHTIADFQNNKYGMKTFQGKVVIGASTNLCLETQTGACAKYNSLPSGYRAYDLYEELEINFNGEWLDAIVLSSCGACFWDREYQTYDIMVDPSVGRFGKIIGEVR